MANRAFIMVAPTGARLAGDAHPSLPVTVPQIVSEAAACAAAGADAVHLHVRDSSGRHCLDPGLYREVLDELAVTAPALLCQISTEAGGRFDPAAQFACVRTLIPSWVSVSIREMARAPDIAARLYGFVDESGGRVQHILYDADDAARLARWRSEGIVPPEQSDVIHVLGRYDGSIAATPDMVSPRLARITSGARQMVCAFGSGEHHCLLAAHRLGADLRVGFENSLIGPDGASWPSNSASVSALRRALVQAQVSSIPA